MHFALPPRKSSNPPPYRPRSSRGGILQFIPGRLRRVRPRAMVLAGVLFLITLFYLLSGSGGSGSSRSSSGKRIPKLAPTGHPPVVLVTVLDDRKFSKGYLEMVKENRERYAEMHGYKTFFPSVTDYDLGSAPSSWALVPAIRHALTTFPNCRFVWYLDQTALIMNPKLKLDEHILASGKLDALMKKDHPVVPPDSIIKTFSHLRAQDVDLVVTQDNETLSPGSIVVRNGDWARFFLDTWFDPIYRTYNFQKAETHALEHIVQWHPTILARMAIVDQRVMGSYAERAPGLEEWREGELVVRFGPCKGESGPQTCEQTAQPYISMWKQAFGV